MHLEQPAPYRSSASRPAVEFSSADLTVVRRAVGSSVGRILGLPRVVHAVTVSRTMLADGRPVAAVTEVIHLRGLVSTERAFKRALWDGRMAVDALLETGTDVTFSRGKVVPLLLTPIDPDATALGVGRESPVLALEETVHGGGGVCLVYARHVVAPDAIDLIVTRTIEPLAVAPISAARRPRTQMVT
jgi:DNA-binding GntR family transcriptional regulator